MAELAELLPARVRAEAPPAVLERWLAGPAWTKAVTCVELAYGKPVTASAEVVGWLAGLTMFVEGHGSLARVLLAAKQRAVMLHAFEAFAAGIAAGLVPTLDHWRTIGKFAAFTKAAPPDVLQAVARGAVADQAVIRASAVALGHALGDRASIRVAIEAGDGAPRAKSAALAAFSDDAVVGDVDDEAFLVRLLDAWVDSGDEALEPMITALGRRIARARGAVVARSKAELEDVWQLVAAACDPADVSRLVDTTWPTKTAALERRLDALAKFPPDPRIVASLVAAASLIQGITARGRHATIATLLSKMPPTSGLAAIDTIERRERGRGEYREARETLEARGRRPPSPPELLAEARRRIGDDRDLRALWAQHVANPADPTTRAVLGDALQRAGEPRGELIACQLALEANPNAQALRSRIKVLIAAHAATLAPLPQLVASESRFARGFLVAARCRASNEQLAACFDDPTWITIEELVLDGWGEIAPLVRRMPLLRHLQVPSAPALRGLVAADLPALRSLVVAYESWTPTAYVLPVLHAIGGDWLRGGSTARSAHERVRAAGAHAIVYPHLLEPQLDDVIAARDAGPAEVRVAVGGWLVKFVRDTPRVALSWTSGARPETLEILVGRFTREQVVVYTPPKPLPRLAAALDGLARSAAPFGLYD